MNKPSGSVSFLFTDIENSAKLAREFPETLQSALSVHHSILNNSIETNNGFVFKIIGDAFCSAFENADDAVKAAVDAQIKLNSGEWTYPLIKVRMGIHSGNAEWNGEDYMGYMTLARSSRVMSTANGGQILISYEAFAKLTENLKDFSFRDLGERRLKDLIQPMRLYQVLSLHLTSEFPPLKTLDARPNNLPLQLSSFIGREKEMIELKTILENSRLLTLLGTGGSGKTRLAVQIGAEVIDEFKNGVFITELSSVSDPSLIIQAIMNSLEVKEEPGKPLKETLTDFLKDKQILLILDNCEHLVRDCAAITVSLLSKCPGLKVIATSRESMNCEGEHNYRIPSLSLPDPSVNISAEKLTQYESVRLFIERALSVNSNFRLDKTKARYLSEICNRLDGIPLALELAAARTKVLTVEKICERLGDRFNLLSGGARTSLPRQQTLRALIDWSYDLLSEEEKILWRRLSIFNGGWTLEAAEEICSDDKIAKPNILSLLSLLSEKSIIIYDEDKDRYKILETLKQYGEERLTESKESEDLLKKHLHYFMKISETSESKLKGNEIQVWLEKLDSDNSNFQSAIEWSVSSNSKEEGVRLAGAIGSFWLVRGQYSTAQRLLESTLDNAQGVSGKSFSKLLKSLGTIFLNMGEYEKSQKIFEKNLALSIEMEYRTGIADSLHYLGNLESRQGFYEQAKKHHEESLSLRREEGDKYGISTCLLSMGSMEYNRGNYDQAQKYFKESLELQREMGDRPGISYSLNNLGSISGHLGNYELANKFLEESLGLQREMGYKQGIAGSLTNLGSIAGHLGNFEPANDYLEESLELQREIGNKPGISISLNNLGLIAIHLGNYERADELLVESLTLNRELKNKNGMIDPLMNLGASKIHQRNFDEAKIFLEESLLLCRESGDKTGAATTLNFLGAIEYYQRNFDTAKDRYKESLTISLSIKDTVNVIESFLGLSGVLSACNDFIPVVLLLGVLETAFKSTGYTLKKMERELYEQILTQLQNKLSDDEFSKYFEEGKTLSFEEASALTLSKIKS